MFLMERITVTMHVDPSSVRILPDPSIDIRHISVIGPFVSPLLFLSPSLSVNENYSSQNPFSLSTIRFRS